MGAVTELYSVFIDSFADSYWSFCTFHIVLEAPDSLVGDIAAPREQLHPAQCLGLRGKLPPQSRSFGTVHLFRIINRAEKLACSEPYHLLSRTRLRSLPPWRANIYDTAGFHLPRKVGRFSILSRCHSLHGCHIVHRLPPTAPPAWHSFYLLRLLPLLLPERLPHGCRRQFLPFSADFINAFNFPYHDSGPLVTGGNFPFTLGFQIN